MPPGTGYVWLCGESSLVRTVRRQQMATEVAARDRIMFMDYWKRGQALDPD